MDDALVVCDFSELEGVVNFLDLQTPSNNQKTLCFLWLKVCVVFAEKTISMIITTPAFPSLARAARQIGYTVAASRREQNQLGSRAPFRL